MMVDARAPWTGAISFTEEDGKRERMLKFWIDVWGANFQTQNDAACENAQQNKLIDTASRYYFD